MNTFGCGIMLLYLKGLMYKMSKLFHARSLAGMSRTLMTEDKEHEPKG